MMSEKMTINALHGANLRSEPAIDASVMGVLNQGEIVTVNSLERGWAEASTDMGDGYVYGDYLSAGPLTTLDTLVAIVHTPRYSSIFVDHIRSTESKYGILGRLREAAFLAQLAHESAEFHYVKEIWGPTSWQKKYEGHHGLGNTHPGDGHRFLGRGLIEVTGRDNYRRCSIALFGDERLLDHPEMLEQPLYAAQSAGWFWADKGINEVADTGDIRAVTKRINPALLGLDKRTAYYKAALDALT